MEFRVDGKQFFPLGGQSHNSSAYNAEEIASAIAGVVALGGNALEAPLYWEQIEPAEGTFELDTVRMLIDACRAAGLKLIVLWFGTWKNGEMRYVPEWVKQDRERFPRVTGYDGSSMQVLSSYAEATRAADERAFVEVCKEIARLDRSPQTVIAVQVENEPGILGSDRDYGEAAEQALAEIVPQELIAALEARGAGPVYDQWQSCGGAAGQAWVPTFGYRGYEYREAWSIARYIDSIAAAGRAHLDRPMYTNVWLGGDGWQVPGFYPAGGPIAALLGIWKAATPHLDTIAPDIYIGNSERYRRVCAEYRRPDNSLFIPESGANDSNAMNMLRAIAEYDAIGFFCFAVDSVLDLDGRLRPEAELFAASFASVQAMLPLILRHRGSGRVHAVYHEDGSAYLPVTLEKYRGMTPYGDMGFHSSVKDHRHRRAPDRGNPPPFGLIVEVGPHEICLAGSFHLHLVPNEPPGWLGALRSPVVATPPNYLSVEEGTLDEEGFFTAIRKRNGDEVVFGGFWVAPDVGVVRVRLAT
jgi:hypothetical protein